MICNSSIIIGIKNPVVVVLLLISVGFLWMHWIVSLHGRGHNNYDHSSHDSNYGVVNIKSNFRYSLPAIRKQNGNKELIADDVGNSMNKTDHDDEIIHMKRSLLQEELFDTKGSSSMKTLSIAHGGDDENDEDAIKKEKALKIKQNGNASTSLYHFYKRMYLPGGVQDLKMLYWKPDGHMDNESLIDNTRDWWHVKNFTSDNTRQPTEYGAIALVLNHDSHNGVPWDVTPPVGVFFYSMPIEHYKSDPTYNYKLVLVPEDRNGLNRGAIAWAMEAASEKAYKDRYNTILWRGTIHNEDSRKILIYNMSSVDKDGNTWLNAKETYDNPGNLLSITDMARDYKYHLDIGGISGTTWVGLRWKMCSGNVIFKVDSWARDWWHDTIIPWEHYIPVKADLSDLYEHWLWVESHPEETYKIAQNGQQKCIEISSEEYTSEYEANIVQSLAPASKELVDEMNLIREGYITLTGWTCC